MENVVFGPVPSRRFGQSVGVNNIPYKVCTYSCVYCQIGKSRIRQTERQSFYDPGEIVRQVERLLESRGTHPEPDYITIVPDGEPTLDSQLGTLLQKLRTFGIRLAVITNGSVMDRGDVCEDLALADYVSVKVDAVSLATWKKINKPLNKESLNSILRGIVNFSKEYEGKLVTETMMVKGYNDSEKEIVEIARFLKQVNPFIVYIATPTRPPACKNIMPAGMSAVTMAYEIFSQHKLSAELLTGYEGNAFASSGNFNADILSITAVHPMRKEAVLQLLARSEATEEILESMVDKGIIKTIRYDGQDYYLRNFGH